MLTVATSPALGRTLWEAKVGPFYSRVVVWDAAELVEPNLRLFYESLSRELKGSRAWTVGVFMDQRDAEREVSGKMRTDPSYDWWLDLYDKFGRDPLPMAEISSYNGDGVLRVRDRFGACTESVLSGDNFLRVHLGAIGFEILKVYYRPLPPHTNPSPGDESVVSVYVRASAFPSSEQAIEFSLLMQRRFQQKRIVVALRADAYFLTDDMFPVVYRFDPKPTPPSREQYEQGKTMYCVSDRPGIQCR
jgi:hypothetical protein